MKYSDAETLLYAADSELDHMYIKSLFMYKHYSYHRKYLETLLAENAGVSLQHAKKYVSLFCLRWL